MIKKNELKTTVFGDSLASQPPTVKSKDFQTAMAISHTDVQNAIGLFPGY